MIIIICNKAKRGNKNKMDEEERIVKQEAAYENMMDRARMRELEGE